MHEMSLMESVIEIAVETARNHSARRIRKVTLELGMLSHVDPGALEFCHDAIRRGTMAEDSTLEILRIPGAGWCLDCGKTVALTERFGACPDCGQSHVQMTAGEEMRIKDMEIE